MKKEIMNVISKIWVNSSVAIILVAIVFLVVLYQIPVEDKGGVIFINTFLAILFSVGIIMGIISICYSAFGKEKLLKLLSKEQSKKDDS